MENIDKYSLFAVANKLNVYELSTLCQTSKKFSELCENDDYWRYRAITLLGYDNNELVEDKVDKQWYMDHAGFLYSKYLLTGHDFKPKLILKNIKSIFYSKSINAVIDGDDNLFFLEKNQQKFIIDNVRLYGTNWVKIFNLGKEILDKSRTKDSISQQYKRLKSSITLY